jgi:hypothetical protein
MSKQMDAAQRFIDAHADELPAPEVQPHHPGDQS